MLGVHAKNLTENGLEVAGKFIPCRVKIWAAGNAASFVGNTLGVPVDRAGRVIVQDDLTIPGHPEVQVIGDLANFTAPKTGQPLPGVSPVAIQQGRHAAENILHMIAGAKPQRVLLLGQGQHGNDRSQPSGGGFKFRPLQWVARVAGVAIHSYSLPRRLPNRLAVLFQWAWAY